MGRDLYQGREPLWFVPQNPLLSLLLARVARTFLGNLLKMQTLRPHPGLLHQKFWGCGPAIFMFLRGFPGDLMHTEVLEPLS